MCLNAKRGGKASKDRQQTYFVERANKISLIFLCKTFDGSGLIDSFKIQKYFYPDRAKVVKLLKPAGVTQKVRLVSKVGLGSKIGKGKLISKVYYVWARLCRSEPDI